MSEKPIPFCVEMVRAILEGRKTETRRVIIPQPPDIPGLDYEQGADGLWRGRISMAFAEPADVPPIKSPYAVGDMLWVKEGLWRTLDNHAAYRADDALVVDARPWQWKRRDVLSCRFMPRWAARIKLVVLDVWPERLQDMGYGAIEAEGFEDMHYSSEDDFIETWDRLNAKRGYSWDRNPAVWAIEFQVMK